MSEEKSASGSAPETKAEQAPPAPPEPGQIGQCLKAKGLAFSPLGNDATGTEMLEVAAEYLLAVSRFLRDDCGFDLLLSCSGVDWKTHLESVYHLYNTKAHQFLAVKVRAENEHSPSLTAVWNAADWHERETYDLFGIQYDEHPKLERILMPSDWLGYPLRKDYKVDDPRLVWNER